jgi:hypothetical protein
MGCQYSINRENAAKCFKKVIHFFRAINIEGPIHKYFYLSNIVEDTKGMFGLSPE